MRVLFATVCCVVAVVLALGVPAAAAVAPARAELTECEACEIVASIAEAALKLTNENTTAVEAFLNKLCNATGKYDSECEIVLMLYVDGIVAALESGEPASKFCTDSIPLCTGNSTAALIAAALQQPASNTSTTCTVCTYLVDALEFVLDSKFFGNLTAAQALGYLEAICNYTGSLSSECDIVVETFGAQIVDELFNDTPAGKVCTQVDACASSPRVPLLALRPVAVETNDTITCNLCDYLVDGLEGVINSGLLGNLTFDGALHFLEGLCRLAGSREAECDDVVQTFGAQIVYELLNHAAPESVCVTVHACPRTLSLAFDRLLKFQLFVDWAVTAE